jgi:hypothetical protein
MPSKRVVPMLVAALVLPINNILKKIFKNVKTYGGEFLLPLPHGLHLLYVFLNK